MGIDREGHYENDCIITSSEHLLLQLAFEVDVLADLIPRAINSRCSS